MVSKAYRCPVCRKPSRKGEPAFPFCSDRCRLLDLGEWFTEGYRVSRPLRPTDDWEPEEIEGPGETEDLRRD